jgi:hypothetical protein
LASIIKFNLFQKLIANGTETVDWDGANIRTALVTSSYTPSATTHDYWSDASANEVSGTNYSANGYVHTMTAVAESAGVSTIDGDDAVWSQSGSGFSSARYAVILVWKGTAATSPMFGYIDLTSDRGNVDGSLTLQWAGTGIFTIS